MNREEYEEIANAYEMAYQDYSGMMRESVPESWRVEAALKDLEELRPLMKEYEDEHPEEFRGQGGDDESDDDILCDEEFLKELKAMSDPGDALKAISRKRTRGR